MISWGNLFLHNAMIFIVIFSKNNIKQIFPAILLLIITEVLVLVLVVLE